MSDDDKRTAVAEHNERLQRMEEAEMMRILDDEDEDQH